MASLLTRDPVLIAAVAVALRLPWALFALPAGIITDRVDRRRLILTMDGLRAFAFASITLLLWAAGPFGTPPEREVAKPFAFGALLLTATVVGVAEVFRDNAAQTMLPSIIPHERLGAANGQLWSVELVGNALIGPALGAFLVAQAVLLPFALNALAYAGAALLLMGLSGSFRPSASTAREWRREVAEGWQFLRGVPLLRLLAWLTGFWNLFFQVAMIGLVLHVQENLGMGAETYGLILAAGAVGGIAGGVFGERIVRRLGPGVTAQWMLFGAAPAFIGIALAPGAPSLAVALAACEFVSLVWNTISVSYRQRVIPDRLLGRVNSLYRLLAWGMMPIGLIFSGLIVRALDGVVAREVALVAPFYAAAAGMLGVALYGWRQLSSTFRISGERWNTTRTKS